MKYDIHIENNGTIEITIEMMSYDVIVESVHFILEIQMWTGIIYYDKLSWLEKLGFLKQRRKFDDLWWWTDKLSVLVLYRGCVYQDPEEILVSIMNFMITRYCNHIENNIIII